MRYGWIFCLIGITFAGVKELESYVQSGEYEKQLQQAVVQGTAKIKPLLRQEGVKWAAVFDVDETLLSNLGYMIPHRFIYDKGRFNQWTQSAQGQAIASVRALYYDLQDQGITMFVLTARPQSQCDITRYHLAQKGIKDYKQMICWQAKDPSTLSAYKAHIRQQIIQAGYRLLVDVSDQASDMANSPHAAVEIKLPNPFYTLDKHMPYHS
ncbi:hypothetical protein N9Y17_04785 [Gammaproteobacteria bacterium]|nr:hypothetical protein [Gammaproteobacteria bacterium]